MLPLSTVGYLCNYSELPFGVCMSLFFQSRILHQRIFIKGQTVKNLLCEDTYMIISLKLHTHKKFNGDSDHKNFPFELIYTRMRNH